jgi:hypothetical protein
MFPRIRGADPLFRRPKLEGVPGIAAMLFG